MAKNGDCENCSVLYIDGQWKISPLHLWSVKAWNQSTIFLLFKKPYKPWEDVYNNMWK